MERPLDALNAAKGQQVIVQLKNKSQITGTLKSFDIHINLVLGNAEQNNEENKTTKLNEIFIRGDMVVFVSPKE
tara:strand:- start:118 stop:339 length:222 start_codon:yes stop_codon:yes gene_type:complete